METDFQMEDTGGLPLLDDQGRVVLIENNQSQLKMLFCALFLTGLVMLSLWYWFEAISGYLAQFYEKIFRIPAIVGLCCAPPAVLFICGFVFPRKLILDGDGIKYRKLGIVSEIDWENVTNITSKTLLSTVGYYRSKGGYEVTLFVIGKHNKIELPAIFGVAQSTLLTYLTAAWRERQGQSRNGGAVEISAPEKEWKPSRVMAFLVTFVLLAGLIVLKLCFPDSSFWLVNTR
jgi:hypothetical protein